ncbi:Aspartyl-tRNA(Asn) amidotransferase subunit B @ Glutamyl-tRNA(Gln) amidotransferase subunit B [hydrothermal vent metagenome]|uniref:Aspartyl-tRNA(Asn) amidotransferase subunit B @ Glutamyl-tRNA(Gln) amidotransferase subunit B n=1 Tax=hydrothermal vent metagenome TaxID=652676 RepID=A0A3B0QRG4_9ZZZZ
MTNYETVIGLEIHAQLKTNSKLFCACPTVFGVEPNTQVCPVCLGMPGVLPVINEKAINYAVQMALALGCKINARSIFARKNYFYPDLPKGYQISQFDEPFSELGEIDIATEGRGPRTIGVTRVHMEDDAGKLQHGEAVATSLRLPEDADSSFVDLNRTGMPLIEIVSEPDMRSADEAVAYFKAIRDIILYLGICDGNMQEGSLRCDANVSIRPEGQEKLGTKAELKNMNSFKFIKDAINFEVARQRDLIESGGAVLQETRLFDPASGVTRPMRTKEEAHDYRYFPEPDLLPLLIPDEMVEELRAKLPELPQAKRARFIAEYKLPPYDAGVLTASKDLAAYFEDTVKLSDDAKTVSNWIMGELLRLLKETSKDLSDSLVTPKKLAGLLTLVKEGKISNKIGKEVFEEIFTTGKEPSAIVEAKGISQISDTGELEGIIDKIIADNQDSVERYRAGKTKLMGFFVGETMKATKGRANPGLVSKMLKEKLS